MPFSTGYFKTETKNYILGKYKKDIKILDIGAGSGTYFNLLSAQGYSNMDCVEAFENYVDTYELRKKYQKVFVGDVTKLEIDFSQYDLIILGDVLEHINLEDAQVLLKKLENKNVIVGVPFEAPQGESFGNTYEIHLQSDLTFIDFFSKYPGFYPLCVRFDYGIFIREATNVINIEVDEYPLPEKYLGFISGRFPNAILRDVNNKETQNTVDTSTKSNNPVTIVTGLWDLGRGNIGESFKRDYSTYLDKMSLLLAADANMCIFADKSDEEFIWKHRKKENTVVYFMSLKELLEWFEFTSKTNEIRKTEAWLSQASWLRESPQATLEGYNPLVMSKMFMLNNVTIFNPFNSEYFFWLDAGIASTVSYGYFSHDKVLNNLPDFIKANEEFVFLTYPYEGGGEIHGFERKAIARYAETDYVGYVCRGGFFGGTKARINEINAIYYSYLNNSLSEGLMGTEESIFSIILYTHPHKVAQYVIEGNGLIWPFFEALKDKDYSTNVILKEKTTSPNQELVNKKNLQIGLYVLTYNFPSQFEKLCISFEEYDKDFLTKPKKYLINNSLDRSTDAAYTSLCEKYGFEEIKKDNIGICGGRQFIAEHAEENELDYSFFFEDDMFFYLGPDAFCRNGFRRQIENFYNKVVGIALGEDFDFLKWNFSEFFGDNTRQWAWYNVPQDVRERLFPEQPDKTVNDSGKEPFLNFKNIKSYQGLPYATGEIYYCNWPQIVSREGNKKMFLDTKWAHPYEQTWMSYIYQETVKSNIKPGLLLATPTEHNRFEHYSKEERREN
jgi:hypothetical protein